MPLPTSRLLLAVACLGVVVLCTAGTASAGGVEGVDVDGTVEANGSVEAGGSLSNGTLDGAVSDAPDSTSSRSLSVDDETGSAADATTGSVENATTGSVENDATASVSDETSLGDADDNGTLSAETGDGDASVDATVNTEAAGVDADVRTEAAGVDATVSDDALDVDASVSADGVSVDGETGLNDTAVDFGVTAGTGTEPPAATKGDGTPAHGEDRTSESDAAVATTQPTEDPPPSDGGERSGSEAPTGTAAAGAVVVGGLAAGRRGMAALANGTAPSTGLYEALLAAIQWLRANLVRALVLLGYSRRDASDPLEHEVRGDLYESIQSTPGLHLSGLEETVDVSLSSVRHHLRVLEDESLIQSEGIRGKRRYFPPYSSNTELVAALEEPATAAVLRELATVDAATVTTLAERLGRDPSTVSHHLTRLEEDGLVERERDEQAVLSRLADGPRRALAAEDPAEAPAIAD